MTWRGDKGSCNVLSNVVKNTAQTMTSMQPALIMLTKPNIFIGTKYSQNSISSSTEN